MGGWVINSKEKDQEIKGPIRKEKKIGQRERSLVEGKKGIIVEKTQRETGVNGKARGRKAETAKNEKVAYCIFTDLAT